MALLTPAGPPAVWAVLALAGPVSLWAQALTQDEALALAFPDATHVDRRTAYLDDGQLLEVERLAGPNVEVATSIVTHYVAMKDRVPLGAAYFDVHRVRTLPEVLMIVVGPDSRVRRVEVVAFHEPPEYRAPARWLRRFHERVLDRRLSLRGEIANMTGATLTSNAVTGAIRRSLALHQVIDPFGADSS